MSRYVCPEHEVPLPSERSACPTCTTDRRTAAPPVSDASNAGAPRPRC